MADKTFNVNQDRTIDPLTVQIYCVGCPFKKVKSGARNPLSNGSTNSMDFGSDPIPHAPTMKIVYECSSPMFNFKQRYSQEHSELGVGHCPFFEQKYELLEGGGDEY